MLPVRRTQVKFLQCLGETTTPSSMLLPSQLPSMPMLGYCVKTISASDKF